jgi:hypothetical protein
MFRLVGVLRIVVAFAFLVSFSYLEHQTGLGIVVSAGVSLFLFIKCRSWLSLTLLAIEYCLFYSGYKYYSYLPFVLLEVTVVTIIPLGSDDSKIKHWKPYEEEIRYEIKTLALL